MSAKITVANEFRQQDKKDQGEHWDCNDEDDALTEAEETAAAAMLAAVFEDDDEDEDDAFTVAEETAATAMLVAVFEDDDEDEAIADGPSVEQMALAGQPWSYSTEEMQLHDVAVYSDPDDVVRIPFASHHLLRAFP